MELNQPDMPDLAEVRIADLPAHAGDPLLESMLERQLQQLRQAPETVSGFSSAI